MKQYFLLKCALICFLSINVSLAHNAEEHNSAEVKKTAQLSMDQSSSDFPSIAVTYEVRTSNQKQDWFMDRKKNAISTYNGVNQQGELWTRNQDGEIEHTRLFMKDKKLVEYTTGELKTMNKFPNWGQLASVFSPKDMARLKITGEKMEFGKKVIVLEGEINKVKTLVWWIPELQIPAYVLQKQGNIDSSMLLKEIFTQTPSEWKWANQATLDTFSKIDASDIGDMENDPFVKKLLEMDGHAH
jgi:hypothetical protein